MTLTSTDREQIQDSLPSSEERYRALVASMDEGFCVIEVMFDDQRRAIDYRFLEVNPSFEKQTGVSGAVGRTMRAIAPDLESHWFETFGRIALTGEAARFQNRAEPLGRWYDVYAFRLGEARNHQVAILFNDISERKTHEVEIAKLNAELRQHAAHLEQVNKELESFSYSVSHDLRAPLRSIDGFSQVLLEDYGDKLEPEGHDALHRVRAAASAMGELIDALLALSRLSRVGLRQEPVDLSALTRATMADLLRAHPERQADFSIAPNLTAHGDLALLRAVMTNLLGNAWKYSEPRAVARIEFGASRHDEETVYFVNDNGVGFDMTYSGKLFGAFQRLHSQAEFKGTGIGLATVQRIIQRHGGRVWADSTPGEGATFYFTLNDRATT